MGFNITSGEVFTFAEGGPLQQHGRMGEKDLPGRRRIIDTFTGTLDTPLSLETWEEELRKNLERVIGLLERGGEGALKEAGTQVHKMVAGRLSLIERSDSPFLYPIEMVVDNENPSFTRIRVISEDTPAFLYTLSNALSRHQVSIEHVRIRTIHGRIEDEIDLVDMQGRKIQDPDLLHRITLSVLLTKQFTYFLGAAPDPFAALSRFENLVRDLIEKRGKEWIELFKNPHTLRDLARLLGTSDFLWEDFIRLHYENLLPMLQSFVGNRPLSLPSHELTERIRQVLERASSEEEKEKALNAFKDREIFLIDLDHILDARADFQVLSSRLTLLAEAVVEAAVRIAYGRLTRRFGIPRTVAGIAVRYTVLGLGKLGGAALGYASDLELLFVYSDHGYTDGKESLRNSEFFDRLVREVTLMIKAKREGIFRVDLRLRPYGNAGPLACSMEAFCRYYGKGGAAHSYERLSLVRLRTVGGDLELGAQVERLRDEIVYFSEGMNLADLGALRERQFKERTEGRLNAKFSPGGLVDLEYGVQILQVRYGRDTPLLRTSRIHQALSALMETGVLLPEEARRLLEAYGFLRRLINSMRMLRGSAEDLFLPQVRSPEFTHLAKRMGYQRAGGLESEEQLRMDLERFTASVRIFVDRHLGSEFLPGPGKKSIADLILSHQMEKDHYDQVLRAIGFKDPERAYRNIEILSGQGERRETFAGLALLAFDILTRKADPDMALNNWERYVRALGSAEFHYNMMLAQPMRLDLLLGIFAGSQFLSDTLVRNPGFLDWVVIPEFLHRLRQRKDIEEELRHAAESSGNHREWLNSLRRLRRREILRIGTRDICLGVPIQETMNELSRLAEAIIQVVMERAPLMSNDPDATHGRDTALKDLFCVLALGKLGGSELNYSSDIDLIALWDDECVFNEEVAGKQQDSKSLFTKFMERIRSDLSDHTEEGYVYRVDLRLRPFGRSGEMISSLSGMTRYYQEKASLWEIQAALKMRPVAGNLRLGYRLMERLQPLIGRHRNRSDIVASIHGTRSESLRHSFTDPSSPVNIKTGMGGIRDVEFLVQGLQLIHLSVHPALMEGNTLTALDLLLEAGFLQETAVIRLKEDYLFLRRIEHYLQILDDLQLHALPTGERESAVLAARILGPGGKKEDMVSQVKTCMERIHETYNEYL